jgi:hypothetical protein
MKAMADKECRGANGVADLNDNENRTASATN